jgi:hypothetical protein
MDTLIPKDSDAVIGSLSGFGRLVFRGTLRRLSEVGGMRSYLRGAKVLLKDFGEHAKQLTQRLKGAAEELAAKASRPFLHLPSSATSKEEEARRIAHEDGIKDGLHAPRRRALHILRPLPQPRGEAPGTGDPCAQVPSHLPLPGPSSVRLHQRPGPDLVPVFRPDLRQRPGVAGPADDRSRHRLPAAGQLFHLARRPGAGAEPDGPAVAGRLAGAAGRHCPDPEPLP